MQATDITIAKRFRHYNRAADRDGKFGPGDEQAFLDAKPTTGEVTRLMQRGYIRGGFPEDYPGRKHLLAAGLLSPGEVDLFERADLLQIPGIGAATADAIIAQRD